MDVDEIGRDANLPETSKHSALRWDATYNVEFNHDTKVSLELNLVHTLTQVTVKDTVRTHTAFSMDGKYLATVSGADMHTFDVRTGKRLL